MLDFVKDEILSKKSSKSLDAKKGQQSQNIMIDISSGTPGYVKSEDKDTAKSILLKL